MDSARHRQITCANLKLKDLAYYQMADSVTEYRSLESPNYMPGTNYFLKKDLKDIKYHWCDFYDDFDLVQEILDVVYYCLHNVCNSVGFSVACKCLCVSRRDRALGQAELLRSRISPIEVYLNGDPKKIERKLCATFELSKFNFNEILERRNLDFVRYSEVIVKVSYRGHDRNKEEGRHGERFYDDDDDEAN